MRIHFIAIGGSAMHNLAIALHLKGLEVSGSDDEVFEPSKSRLEKHGLLPKKMGWDPTRITNEIDAIILGMHAREDNPELKKAQELGIRIYSYPEYLYEASKDKLRVVIAGSHGKTSITAMVLHVLNHIGKDVDYMVGAQLEGFDTMVKLTSDASIIVLEGDEYLSSPIDRSPKFLWYQPHVALLSGIAWDHINVFPTFENYLEQFSLFIDSLPESGSLVYCEVDQHVKNLVEQSNKNIQKIPYSTPAHKIDEGVSILKTDFGDYALQVFGAHNLQNLNGARKVLNELNVSDEQFYEAITSFKGASKRLELIGENKFTAVFKDYAHSPSKLKATINAVKAQFPERELVACMELHTFSSLNKRFLEQYKGAMDAADKAIVYFNPKTIAHKQLPEISKEEVEAAFAKEGLTVMIDSERMQNYLKGLEWRGKNLLLMSSGNFDGIELNAFGKEIAENTAQKEQD